MVTQSKPITRAEKKDFIAMHFFLFCHSFAMIPESQGAYPIGFALIFGLFSKELFVFSIAGWISILIIVLAMSRKDKSSFSRLFYIATLLLVASWVIFISKSQHVSFTIATSIPFFGSGILWVFKLKEVRVKWLCMDYWLIVDGADGDNMAGFS